MRRGSGWYRLPSGQVIHLTANTVPSADALAALDDVAQAAQRWMAIHRLRNVLQALATGSQTYRPNPTGTAR